MLAVLVVLRKDNSFMDLVIEPQVWLRQRLGHSGVGENGVYGQEVSRERLPSHSPRRRELRSLDALGLALLSSARELRNPRQISRVVRTLFGFHRVFAAGESGP